MSNGRSIDELVRLVAARLHCRSFGQHLADQLSSEGAVTVPSVGMVAVEEIVAVADLSTHYATLPAEPPAPAPSSRRCWPPGATRAGCSCRA